MNNSNIEKLGKAYFFAKKYVIKKGFADEIDLSDSNDFDKINEQQFLKEAAWVILSSGMSYYIISRKFDQMTEAFLNWDINQINKNESQCKKDGLKIINYPGKINGIIYISKVIETYGFKDLKKRILEKGIESLQEFPFIGPATAYHLAKNIGFNVTKPDRHLLRISKATGFSSPNDLCACLSKRISEKVSTIDLVIWRYATIDKNYLSKINYLLR
jgi:hypothetical protein